MLSSRKKSSRKVYHFSIRHNNTTFILWQLKIKASVESCCFQKFLESFQTALRYLKVISNIVYYPLGKITFQGRPRKTSYSRPQGPLCNANRQPHPPPPHPQYPEDILKTSQCNVHIADAHIFSYMYRRGTSSNNVLRTSPAEVLKTSLYGSNM